MGLCVGEVLDRQFSIGRYCFLVRLRARRITAQHDFRSKPPCHLAGLVEADVGVATDLMLTLTAGLIEVAEVVRLAACRANLEDESRGVGIPVIDLFLARIALGRQTECRV